MATGPGSLDAQGVWMFGEDDAESLASDLLNIGQESISDQFAADRVRLTAAEADIAALEPKAAAVGVVCMLRKSANQNLSTSASALSWDVEISDTSGMHSPAQNTRIVAPAAGVYEFTAQVYNNNTSGIGAIYGRANGSANVLGSFQRGTADSAALPLSTTFSLVMAAGDYVEIMVLHSAAAGSIEGGTNNTSALVVAKRIA